MRCTRCDRPICPDCMRPAAVGFHCPECVKEGRAAMRPVKAVYGGRARANPEVTYTLIGLNVVMFFLTGGYRVGFGGGGVTSLFSDLALTPCAAFTSNGICPSSVPGVANGEYYRLLSSMFLHFGVIHIGLNMYCLFLLGPALERALGRLRFASLYLISGVAGSTLSYVLGPTTEQAAGASGAVFGLFAAFYVIERRHGADVSAITSTIFLNLVFSFAVPGIDWRGHVGGLIGGALVTGALVYAPTGKNRWVVQALGCVCVALVVVAAVALRTHALTTL